MKTDNENKIDSMCLAIWAYLILLFLLFAGAFVYAASVVYDFLSKII